MVRIKIYQTVIVRSVLFVQNFVERDTANIRFFPILLLLSLWTETIRAGIMRIGTRPEYDAKQNIVPLLPLYGWFPTFWEFHLLLAKRQIMRTTYSPVQYFPVRLDTC